MHEISRRAFLASSAGLAITSIALSGAKAQSAIREIRIGMVEDPQTLDPANHRNRTTETVIRNLTDGLDRKSVV